jgi:hypothetical protein
MILSHIVAPAFRLGRKGAAKAKGEFGSHGRKFFSRELQRAQLPKS